MGVASVMTRVYITTLVFSMYHVDMMVPPFNYPINPQSPPLQPVCTASNFCTVFVKVHVTVWL